MLDRPVGARDEAIALVRTLRSIGVLAVTVPHSRIRHTLPPTDHDTPSATTNNSAFAKITLCPTCVCAECVCLLCLCVLRITRGARSAYGQRAMATLVGRAM